MLDFIIKMFTSRCMEPSCTNKGTNYPHGIPCCDEHYHESDCGVWVNMDCDCRTEGGTT
jgi:hypothetical protein